MVTELLLCSDHRSLLNPSPMLAFIGNNVSLLLKRNRFGTGTGFCIVANLTTSVASFLFAIQLGMIIIPTTLALGFGIRMIAQVRQMRGAPTSVAGRQRVESVTTTRGGLSGSTGSPRKGYRRRPGLGRWWFISRGIRHFNVGRYCYLGCRGWGTNHCLP